MRKVLFFFVSVCFSFSMRAQVQINADCASYSDLPNYMLSFEDTNYYNRVLIDTVNFSGNIWQIGKPNKQMFDSSFSIQNCIVTDTINSYPINNYSVFQLKVVMPPANFQFLDIRCWYRMNSDSLHDGGIIETSQDNGITWKNVANDPMVIWNGPNQQFYDTLSANGQLGISGGLCSNINSFAGWDMFSFWLQDQNSNVWDDDTVLIRFVFVSDSISDNLDGWQIDNLMVDDICESIQEYSADNSLSIFPNPSSGIFEINSDLPNEEKLISVFAVDGKKVFDKEITVDKIDLTFLPNGIYEMMVDQGIHRTSKRILINK